MTQGDFLYQAASATGFYHIALSHLIFQQYKKTIEIITDQALRSETDCDADYACGRQDGGDRNAELMENFHAGNGADENGGDIVKYAADGVDAFQLLGLACGATFQVLVEGIDELAAKAHHYASYRQQQHDAERNF